MITQEEHLSRILHLISPLRVTEVPLNEALGQTLAANVTASVDLPPWDSAAMDGYAICLQDFTPGTLPVTRTIPAGHRQQESIGSGEAAAIMTGAPVPEGADTIVPLEFFHEPTQDVPTEITFDQMRLIGTSANAPKTPQPGPLWRSRTFLRPNHIGLCGHRYR